MNIFFDTEFTGLVPGTQLISLGCVSEYGEKFYAEFTDFDENKCNYWIKENVLKNLINKKTDYNYLGDIVYVHGDSDEIRDELICWLQKIRRKERIQFISDVCHYDFYLLVNQVFYGAFQMPDFINPVCYDICQDICLSDEVNADSMYAAFNESREELCERLIGSVPEGIKHNALYDALVIKEIHNNNKIWR